MQCPLWPKKIEKPYLELSSRMSKLGRLSWLKSSRKYYSEGIINELPANMITCKMRDFLYFVSVTRFILQCVNLNLPPWVIFFGDWRTLAGWGILRPSWMQESSLQRYANAENRNYGAEQPVYSDFRMEILLPRVSSSVLNWVIPNGELALQTSMKSALWRWDFVRGWCSVDSISSRRSSGKILSEWSLFS